MPTWGQRFAQTCKKNLTGPGISESNLPGGHCAGFIRENLWETDGAEGEPPTGLDAIQQCRYLLRHGWREVDPTRTMIGDLYYKLNGKHGHVGCRIPGNRLAENSTVHGIGNEDARGTRTIKAWGRPDKVLRRNATQ